MAKDTALHLPLGLESVGWVLGLLTTSILYFFLSPKSQIPRPPVVNKYWWDFFQIKAKRDFDARAEDLIKLGLSKARAKNTERGVEDTGQSSLTATVALCV